MKKLILTLSLLTSLGVQAQAIGTSKVVKFQLDSCELRRSGEGHREALNVIAKKFFDYEFKKECYRFLRHCHIGEIKMKCVQASSPSNKKLKVEAKFHYFEEVLP